MAEKKEPGQARRWTAARREAASRQLHENGTVDGSGVAFSGEDVQWMIASAPRMKGHPHFMNAHFENATFGLPERGSRGPSRVDFSFAVFDGAVTSFEHAKFLGDADFDGCDFLSEVELGAEFRGDCSFNSADFRGGVTSFQGATFHGQSSFLGSTFHGMASFASTTFLDFASFQSTQFKESVQFALPGKEPAVFKSMAFFLSATFAEGAVLTAIADRVELSEAVLARPHEVALVAGEVIASHLTMPQGGVIAVRFATVYLDDVRLEAPTTLVALEPSTTWRYVDRDQAALLDHAFLENSRIRHPDRPLAHDQRGELDPRPRLASLVGSDVANLTCTNVAMGSCDLRSVTGLDRLRLEGATGFLPTPRLAWPRRLTRRQTLLDEHRLRGWPPASGEPAGSPLHGQELRTEARRVAGLYQSLRKAREDRRDEPGAADFYYGEMEMRRRALPWWSVERWILTGYWLVSGYGLRAWRAVCGFCLAVGVGTVLFHLWGFTQTIKKSSPVYAPPPHDWGSAFQASIESTTSVLRSLSVNWELTMLGELTQLALRILGPALLALAALAIRARVKR
jgi:uncharacterized protein YjbI with pentapeptide repeats